MLNMSNRIAINSQGGFLGTRYFTTLDGAADYYTIPQIDIVNSTDDFTISFKHAISSSTTGDLCIISDDADNTWIRIDATNNEIDTKINGSFRSAVATGLTLDGKLHEIELVYTWSGGELTLVIIEDGVQIDSDASTPTGDFFFSALGRRAAVSGNYFNGVISDVKITDGTGLIRDYKIDEDLSATSTIIDSGSDGSNGTAVSITSSELFTLVGCSWVGSTKTIVIAGCTP